MGMRIRFPFRTEMNNYSSEDTSRECYRRPKCCCLRGGKSMANNFGRWDHFACDLPKNTVQRHISNGNFLLDHVEQSQTQVKRQRRSEGGHGSARVELHKRKESEFYHFKSVDSHIQHYRETKYRTSTSCNDSSNSNDQGCSETEQNTIHDYEDP